MYLSKLSFTKYYLIKYIKEAINIKDKKSTSFYILCYVIVTYVVSGIGYYIWFQTKNNESIAAMITILAPLIGALSVYLLSGRTICLKLKGISIKSIITGICIGSSYILISVCIFFITGNKLNNLSITKAEIISGIISWIFAGFCEEIGWRCVLMPLLKKKFNYYIACILTALIWAGWHVPLVIGGLMYTQFTIGIALLMLFLEILALSLILGVISEIKSVDNVWTYTCYHATHNIIYMFLFNSISENDYKLIDDGGYILVSVLLVLSFTINAVYIHKKKSCKIKSISVSK